MYDRTDLAVEEAACHEDSLPPGVTLREERRGPFQVTRVTIATAQGSQALGKPPGTYVTVEGEPMADSTRLEEMAILTARELSSLLPPEGPVLVVGLGNHNVTPDALGPKAAQQVVVTYHLPARHLSPSGREGLRPVAVLSPGVLGQTGLEAGSVASWAAQRLPLGAVIAVDALAAREPRRLGRTIQLGDSGIVPGSGVEGGHQELSLSTLGVPVIAVGVPTVIDTGHFSQGQEDTAMMVTPHQVDRLILRASQTVALALNLALQPSLSLRELRTLMA